MSSPPWDSRIARVLVAPLRHLPVHPNAVTTVSLLLGLIAGAFFAQGDRAAANWGAAIFMLATLIDHADGELARMTGTSARFGHYFDQVVGAVNYVVFFTCIGIGLRDGPLGPLAPVLGCAAAASVTLIHMLRLLMEHQYGRSAHDQPSVAGVEVEDLMYLIGPITWLGGLGIFLPAASVGAPIFLLWVALEYVSARREAAEVNAAESGHDRS